MHGNLVPFYTTILLSKVKESFGLLCFHILIQFCFGFQADLLSPASLFKIHKPNCATMYSIFTIWTFCISLCIKDCSLITLEEN